MKKKRINYFKYFNLFFAMIILVLVVGCNGPSPTAPIINSFLANPTTITEGESSTLSWSVTDAATVTIDNGIGSVALTGTTAVNPTTTTTYTLTATNTAGSVTGSVTVTVGAAYGSIDINSTPTGAKVYLDGVDTGSVTPYVITHVEAGIHIIKLDKYLYNIQEDTNVSVNAGETTYLNWSLTYASIQTITLQPGSEGKDDYISSALPDSNYGNWNKFYVGTFSVSDYYRAYLQFDLSTIPADARITDADLTLYQYSSVGSGNFQIGLHKVTSNWEEDTITCNLQPTSSSETEALRTVYTGSTTWRSWDIDDLVQGWLDGSITNRGMLLKSTDETLSSIGIYFHSSDYTTDATKRPKLVIDYYIP
ncbi:hypothetical protein ES705_22283 [subsurface metagenome]